MGNFVFIGHSVVKGTDYGGVTATAAFAYKIGIAAGYHDVDIYNKGKSSDTVSGMLARASTDVDDLLPEVCCVMIGVNDWISSTPVVNFKTDLLAFVTGRQALGIKVVLFTDNMYRGTASEFGSYYAYIEAIKEVALLSHCNVVDLYGRMCQQAMIGNHASNYADMIHLSIAGHDFVTALAMKSYHAGFFVKDPVVVTPEPEDLKPLLVALADSAIITLNPALTAGISLELEKLT